MRTQLEATQWLKCKRDSEPVRKELRGIFVRVQEVRVPAGNEKLI